MKKENDTIYKKYDSKNNSFTLLGICLSIIIIIYHCFPLYYGSNSGKVDLLSKLINVENTGSIVVAMFFVISGFMITTSIKKSKSNLKFLWKRVKRIFPPLIFTILLSALVLAPIVSSIPKYDFLANISLYKKYIIDNIIIFPNTVYAIETVFVDNIYPYAINGSLWTIKHQFFMYIYIIPLFLIFFKKNQTKKRKYFLYYSLILFTIYLLVNLGNFSNIVSYIQDFKYFGITTEFSLFIRLLYYFTAGVFMNIFSDKIKCDKKSVLFMLIIFLLTFRSNCFNIFAMILIPYFTILLGSIPQKIKLPDISYYIYLIAFPVQQTLYHYFEQSINLYVYMILSIFISVIISLIYYFIFNRLPKWFNARSVKKNEI